jgi:hypothetical protein
VQKARATQAVKNSADATKAGQRAALRYEFPYDPAYADAADRNAPDFGWLWSWASSPCASNTWRP